MAPTGPPAVIREFGGRARGDRAGRAPTLRWEALDAYSLSIEPGVGSVATRGTQRVSPERHDDPTRSRRRARAGRHRTVTVTSTARPPPPPRRAPRAERPAQIRSCRRRTQPVRVLHPGAQPAPGRRRPARSPAPNRSVSKRNPGGDAVTGVDCLPPGVPAATMLPFPFQIVHAPGVLVIMYEAYHQFRMVPVGREHAEYLAARVVGHSVAAGTATRWSSTYAASTTGPSSRVIDIPRICASMERYSAPLTRRSSTRRTSATRTCSRKRCATRHVHAAPRVGDRRIRLRRERPGLRRAVRGGVSVSSPGI